MERVIREVKASADSMITKKSKELQMELENRKAFVEAAEKREAERKKEEQERRQLNININLNINIPGIDVIEQRIPLKIDPNSIRDIDINVTKPEKDRG